MEYSMCGTPVEQSLSLWNMVDIMENVTVGSETKSILGSENTNIEQQSSHEGSSVRLVDDQDVVLNVLSHEEGVHVPDKGGQV